MLSQTSPFGQRMHKKVHIAEAELFTGHWWKWSTLLAFRDCSGHKRETLLDIAAPTDWCDQCSTTCPPFWTAKRNFPRRRNWFTIQSKQNEGCREARFRIDRYPWTYRPGRQSYVRPPKTHEGHENHACSNCITNRPPHVFLLTSCLHAKRHACM